MTNAEILTMLQVDLGELYPNEQRAAYLTQAISAAQAFITREGVALTDSIEDGQLVEMYAAYLVRKRATTEPMPRMLRWALNNRLFSQKAQVYDGP
jgi:hypothetical protein|nr:MAG TPA: Head Tail Connector Protein [Caudoviricetes sp.]